MGMEWSEEVVCVCNKLGVYVYRKSGGEEEGQSRRSEVRGWICMLE